ncbi:Ig-like domain-containing protein [Dapis sp. BLCC M229]|uniref:Ig-like domain-containing protein n=1 Tax=Dapis sp. BLCC M229 TaxID=3400188 RepID=UPI003CF3AB5B
MNPDGTYSYTPPAQGDVPEGGLTEVFNYTITDVDGDTSSTTLTISVDNVNAAPNAQNDSFTVEANENNGDGFNSSVSGNVITNDIDDGSLTVTSNTNPNNGSISLDANGDLTYTPTPGFSGGSDTFQYTVSDGSLTDTATVEITIVDPGRQTTSDQDTLGSQTVKLDLTTEEQTANSTTFVEGFLSTPEFQPPFNIGIVIDVSSSTVLFNTVDNGNVGDVNNDGLSNSVLDYEIQSTLNLLQSIVDAPGLDNDTVDIGLITFGTQGTLVTDNGSNYDLVDPNDSTAINPDLVNAITSLTTPDSSPFQFTNFDDGLDKAIDFFDAEADKNTATNLMYFISDGVPNIGGDGDGESGTGTNVGDNNANATNYTSELAALDNLSVQRNSIGVTAGSNIASGSALQEIDNTGGAQQVIEPDELTGVLLNNPVVGEVIDFEVSVNGTVQPGIDEDDLISGPLGYSFGPFVVDNLDPSLGTSNSIVATGTLDLDGNPSTIDDQLMLTATNNINGALPLI